MLWIAPSEKDADNAALEKRLARAAYQFRAHSGLKSQVSSAPARGLIVGPVCGLRGVVVSSARFVLGDALNLSVLLS
jgi:hypothetical protein